MHQLLNINTGKTTDIPSDIDELDSEQYLQYLELVTSETDIPVIKKKLFYILCQVQVPVSFAFMKKSKKEPIFDNLFLFIDQTDSFFDIEEMDGKRMYRPHMKSGRNLLPTYCQYKGPDDMLNDISWGDFVDCMNLINSQQSAVNSEQSQPVIDGIFNILYKPDKNYSMLARRAKVAPDHVKLHAFNLFMYVFELISSCPIPINGEEIDFRILFSGKGKKKDDKTGWAGLVFSIAESGVFGKTEDVNSEKFWNVLIYLYKCTFEQSTVSSEQSTINRKYGKYK